MNERNAWFVLGSVAAVISIAISFFVSSLEIPSNKYSRVDLWILESPSVRPLVFELMSDGKLTNNEYSDIKQYVEDEPKRLVLQKVSEAQ